MHQLALALLVLSLHVVPATAQDQWQEFRSDTGGFSISLPQTPTITSRQIKNTKATQTMFLIELGDITYLVSVIQLEKGTGPKNPNQAYFKNLLKNYAEGSKTTVRTSKAATIVGKPGIDAICDVRQSAHLVQILTSGDRVYLVVYVGPKGLENGADPTRFRDSFKLIK